MIIEEKKHSSNKKIFRWTWKTFINQHDQHHCRHPSQYNQHNNHNPSQQNQYPFNSQQISKQQNHHSMFNISITINTTLSTSFHYQNSMKNINDHYQHNIINGSTPIITVGSSSVSLSTQHHKLHTTITTAWSHLCHSLSRHKQHQYHCHHSIINIIITVITA